MNEPTPSNTPAPPLWRNPGASGPAVIGDRVLARGEDRGEYRLRLARTPADVHAAQSLRFEVFNVELNEGLAHSFATRRDADPFDEVCDHLIVEVAATQTVVGTYRLQSGQTASAQRGYYSGQEFDLTPYEPLRAQVLELGRACVHADHRNLAVLSLLWRGINQYARERGLRYLIGCSSLTSQDPAVGAAMYLELKNDHLVEAALFTRPQPGWECPLDHPAPRAPKVPKLLRAYLSLGARIGGPPAIDREFKTIDFLTWLDLDSLPPETVRRYLS